MGGHGSPGRMEGSGRAERTAQDERPLESAQHRQQQLTPDRVVEIDDAHVLSMLDRPEAMTTAMSDFLLG
ncbi:hypothetical protein NDR87_02655 [Nocardia sp. CDC159]|uniref:Uncharacterized protein n=1 Tax=Nocardia pulmonis TaxID=2951408 RepID=A0A9X2ITS2_9NOCA|nr:MULTISPECIES: hypothetical protein [Nocardia]MCM6772087.1 hypothetical protein [Nocardia pulmonis]MCM6785255.1 hypothetical protein [Nocardia sp. CDC159]